MNNKPFNFVLNIPVQPPGPEQVELAEEHVKFDKPLQTLLDSGELTIEEALAYIDFAARLASAVPFMFDEFIAAYRRQTTEED